MKDPLELLIYSLDNNLSEVEQKQLETALKNSAKLRAEKLEYEKLRENISGYSAPSYPNFTDGVMKKWALKNNRINFGKRVIKLFPKVAAAAAIFILVTWSIIHFSKEEFISEKLIVIEDISPEEAYTLLEL